MIVCTADNPYQTSQDGSREAWRADHNRLYHADHEHHWFPFEQPYPYTACIAPDCNVRKPFDYKPGQCELIETATWCVQRNGYADDSTCSATPELHVHYDVQYGVDSGKVVTSAAEQQRRRIAASPTSRLWQEVTYDLLHVSLGPIHSSTTFLMQHPAMVEILHRERQQVRENLTGRHRR